MSSDDALVASAGEGQCLTEGSVLPTAARVVAPGVVRSGAVHAGRPVDSQRKELLGALSGKVA